MTKLMDEFSIIDSLDSKTISDVLIGIGDDCAVLSKKFGNLVITQDAVVEDVHFDMQYSTPKNVANKLFNSNLSDLASMGTYPKFALITAAISQQFKEKYLEEFILEVNKIIENYNISLIGGDTVSSSTTMFSLTLMGENSNSTNLTRHSANVGDLICVSGYLGLSAYGLQLLKSGSLEPIEVIDNHLNGINRLDLVDFLNSSPITSITDISDGLAFSINLLLDKNQGAKVYNLPISKYMSSLSHENIYKYIFFGGEDYELLYTIPKSNKDIIPKSSFIIGEITDTGIVEYNGNEVQVAGYNHFS